MSLIYHSDAEAELMEAAQFYERQVPTLGAQFLDATDRAIGVIQEAPDRWIVMEAVVCHYLMPRFPYAIYYRALPDQNGSGRGLSWYRALCGLCSGFFRCSFTGRIIRRAAAPSP